MTNRERKNFYNDDEKLYDLKENKKFLTMFNHLIDEKYDVFIGVDEMQDLIDTIVNWYEIKYPEREFDFYDGKMTLDFIKCAELSNFMDIKQLFFRLTDNQQKLLAGLYRSKCEKEFSILDNGEVVYTGKKVIYRVDRTVNDTYYNKHKDFIVSADAETGMVDIDYEIEKYIFTDEICISDLVKLFEAEYADRLDFLELKKADNNKYLDNYLRNRLLDFVALKLLYSKRTTPERGYERAKRFILEFNKKLGLDLSCETIDNIIKKDYSESISGVKKLQI